MSLLFPQHVSLTDLLTKLTFCSLDLETTGTNPALHAIVEIGMVKFTLNDTIDNYQSLINPGGAIPKNVIDIHGITDQMVANASKITDIINDIYKFIDNSILVIHNPRFDLSFLKTIKVKGIDTKRVLQAIDTVRMARKTFPDFPNHKLETLSKQLNINIDTHHRALSDSFACKEVFRQTIDRLDTKRTWTLNDLVRFHGNLIKPRYKRKVLISDVHIVGLKIGQQVTISYKDSDGNFTKRDIVPKYFVRVGGKRYVYAYCGLRKEYRYFKANRIIDVE